MRATSLQPDQQPAGHHVGPRLHPGQGQAVCAKIERCEPCRPAQTLHIAQGCMHDQIGLARTWQAQVDALRTAIDDMAKHARACLSTESFGKATTPTEGQK